MHLDPDNPASQAVSVYFPSKGTVHVPWGYLTHRFVDGRDGGLAHAYAITAARAQGTTMDTASAVVPDDTSRAGLYVMLSRARTDVAAYLVARDELDDRDDRDDDETWLPTEPSPQGPVGQLADRLSRSRPEQQAGEQDPLATVAHQLRRQHSLAELTALRLRQPPNAVAAPRQVVLRRAELASEAALRAAALTKPPAALVARIGPRPAAGPDRAAWDEVVSALAIYHARHRPNVSPHEVGPPPIVGPCGLAADPWLIRRQEAVRLADSWAAALPRVLRDRSAAPVRRCHGSGRSLGYTPCSTPATNPKTCGPSSPKHPSTEYGPARRFSNTASPTSAGPPASTPAATNCRPHAPLSRNGTTCSTSCSPPRSTTSPLGRPPTSRPSGTRLLTH
jgi:hypothetical protein